MVGLLKKIYHKFSDNRLIRFLGKIYLNGLYIGNKKSYNNIKKVHKAYIKKNKSIINVLFIVQVPELWDKQSSVYDLMKKDEHFNPEILVVPKYNLKSGKVEEFGEELEYFESNYDKIIKYEKGKIDTKEVKKYDFVFYQRVYDVYMPNEIKMSEVAKYSKICYIPYATPEIADTEIYSKVYYRNVSIAFMETKEAAEIMKNKFKKSVAKGYQRFVFEGYPTFEKILKEKKDCKYRRVLWTPRWSYDSVVGGSHFFEYKDFINDYSQSGRLDVTIRPHPMMFDNFIKTGLMSEEDKNNYLEEVRNAGVIMDSNASIEETLKETDIMISDRSSVIPLFFLTGKPVIYCPFDAEYGDLFNMILPGIYKVESEQELKKILDDLSEGKDELKETRKRIINDNFNGNVNASSNIVNYLLNFK